ncbi:MAG TPA: nuclear transport factor 2 family protein [Terriglobales bacterium]|nr:nuclear transport factor 2 family protein [Terriglobales bacterium]
MPTKAKKRSTRTKARVQSALRKKNKPSAAATIRRIGDEWARHWNAGELDGVVAAYAEDAVYLPPHHEAVHGREAIRDYVRVPLGHGVSDLAFEVTYIKQEGSIAWDVGTYRMTVPRNDGSRNEDRGKYLTVWRRIGNKWLIVADAWSSDLPVSG